MKKCLSLLLVVVMLATFVLGAVPVSAESTDEFNYRIDNGEITLTRYVGAGGAVVIPSTIGGLPVVTIGSSLYRRTIRR